VVNANSLQNERRVILLIRIPPLAHDQVEENTRIAATYVPG
jgi:hypothetical protein